MRSIISIIVFGLAAFLFAMPATLCGQVNTAADDQPSALYRIQRGDKLNIKFYSNPELNEASMLVRPDGFINPQLINEVRAEGKTVAELKAELERSYVEILLSPMITVSVVDLVTPRIFVGGQINKPGRYELREAKTLVQAIFLAGSFTKEANRTMVIRARPKGNGDWAIDTANVLQILEQKGNAKDLMLQDGDFVFVADSKLSQFNKIVESFRGVLPRFF
ncbi:MAG TPA: polysaccharide biosynthesis/export family protein [Pyrinomonadaceae bacterium]|nr:polysaccharide biosynthesis/export family protein [Pyrinomonadaceae bacterium]